MSEEQRNFPSATNHSASSRFCYGTSGHLSGTGCGNNASVDQTAIGGSVVESGKNEGSTVFCMNYQQDAQREEALNKFCLKKKVVSTRSGTGGGNNGNVDQTTIGGSVFENRKCEGSTVFYMDYQRNAQMEEALNKFHLKENERYFGKKVRYESRKKFAEKRPQMKGQFVRQMPTSIETNSRCSNSLNGQLTVERCLRINPYLLVQILKLMHF